MKSGYRLYNQGQLERAIREESQKVAEQLRDEIWDREKDSLCAQIFAEVCYSLHTDFDFGEVRLKRLHDSVNALNEFMRTGFAGKGSDAMDCVAWLKDYAGIDVMEGLNDER